MIFVKIVLLFLWAAYSWSMGQIAPSGLNAFGKLVAGSFFIAAPALYLFPTYEAWRRQHRNVGAIALVDVFLGWSLIGWVGALVWATRNSEPVSAIEAPVVTAPRPAWETRSVRSCPYCAEEILAAAIKCKHCGSQVTPAATTT